jgi:hypothetical protein
VRILVCVACTFRCWPHICVFSWWLLHERAHTLRMLPVACPLSCVAFLAAVAFPQEPEFFTQICNFNAMRCRKGDQVRYLREVRGAHCAHWAAALSCRTSGCAACGAGRRCAAQPQAMHNAAQRGWLAGG